MPAASVVIPAGALRFARAPRPGLLPATTQKAQISAGLSFCLDEKRGSRHPASMSIHEESTVVAERPVMGVFNNLVLFDQHVKQNSLGTILPELAKSWSWNEEGTELTFQLRDGVKWHDGKPFTAADVKCTWELLKGEGSEKL